MSLQVPNSSGNNVLVNINMKANPVAIVIVLINKEIKPEYVTRISDNFTHFFYGFLYQEFLKFH